MYVIQVNAQYWLVGIWRGWLMLSQSPTGAGAFRSQAAAQKAVEEYSQLASDNRYTICESSAVGLEW